MMIFIRRISTSNLVKSLTKPPSHFSAGTLPSVYPPTHFNSSDTHSFQNLSSATRNIYLNNFDDQNSNNNNSNGNSDKYSKSIKELTILVTIVALSFIAIDNYLNRIKLEKLINETNIINIKTLKLQQANFTNALKRKNLQIIAERRENGKKFTKMGLHIALLRKQLLDLGQDPSSVEAALLEYEKTVKVNTAFLNVTDQIVYLSEDSILKEFFPNVHEYDSKTAKKETSMKE